MAITINTTPLYFAPAYRPVNFNVESDRLDANQRDITTFADGGGGKTQITTNAAHGYYADDIILNEGTTDGYYDGSFTVTDIVDVTNYKILKTFVAKAGAGTTTRTNINFQIRADVIDGSANTIGSIRQKDVSGTFDFDVANYLRTVLEHYFYLPFGLTDITYDSKTIENYTVKFTEEFDDLDGLLFEGDDDTSSGKKVLNATLQHLETQTLTAFELLNGQTRRFLTNSPEKKIRVDEEEQVGFFISNQGGMDDIRLKYQTYDLNGNANGWNEKAIKDFSTNKRGIVGVNSELGISSSVSKLEIKIYDETHGADISETKVFIIDHLCYNSPVRVHFLNRLGAFDSFTFTGYKKEIIKSKKVLFEKGLALSFNIEDRGSTVLGIKAYQVFQVFSQYLNYTTLQWLSELLTSPEVYIQQTISGTKKIIPIIVSNKSDVIADDSGMVKIKLIYAMANELIIQNN